MRLAVAFFAFLATAAAIAAPGENHWGEPTKQGALYQSLSDARDRIDAGTPEAAIVILMPLTETHPNEADVFNLLGFARRKTGDLDGSASAYVRALELDRDHLGALEYQGELFLTLDLPDDAERNLVRLTALCGMDCEERKDLAVAIAEWRATRNLLGVDIDLMPSCCVTRC